MTTIAKMTWTKRLIDENPLVCCDPLEVLDEVLERFFLAILMIASAHAAMVPMMQRH